MSVEVGQMVMCLDVVPIHVGFRGNLTSSSSVPVHIGSVWEDGFGLMRARDVADE